MASNDQLLDHVLDGRYRLLSRRGVGAHGAVMDAVDEQLQRPVAVKLLLSEFVGSTASESRFRLEAQVASSLSHPNLNAVYDWGVATIEGERVPYVVVERLTGGSLRDMLDRGRLLSPSQALIVGLDVCRGLDYMHRRGVIHRDIRPASIAFGDDRHVRLLDVGISRMVAEQIWREPTSAGLDAARYASPEQAVGATPEDGRLTAATDIYSLCIVLIEAVTGQAPFASDSTVATLNARLDKLMPVSADFGPLASVLSRAGRADASDRYSAAEFGRALVQAAEKLPRPAAIPIVSAGAMFGDDTAAMRRPSDPTGPVMRPGALPTVAVPVTAEPSGAAPDASAPPMLKIVLAESAEAEIGADASTAVASGVDAADAPTAVLATQTSGAFADTAVAPIVLAASAAVDADDARVVDGSGPIELYDEEEVDAPRRRWGAWAAAIIVVILALGAGGILAMSLMGETAHDVPALAGMEEGVARNEISSNDWTVVIQSEHSDEQPVGDVIRTEPPEGTKLNEGRSIVLVVSLGPTLTLLPDVTGMTLQVATDTLTESKLQISVADEVHDEAVPTGEVISWMVAAQPGLKVGDEVIQRTTVSVVVSTGPAPREVPQLIGLDEAAATQAVNDLQLVLVKDVDKFSPTQAAGLVADQSVPAGTSLERGATVVIALSKGPDLVSVPPLGGLTLAQVEQTLAEAGLKIGSVVGPSQTGVLTNATVNGVAILPGNTFYRDTPIDITFS